MATILLGLNALITPRCTQNIDTPPRMTFMKYRHLHLQQTFTCITTLEWVIELCLWYRFYGSIVCMVKSAKRLNDTPKFVKMAFIHACFGACHYLKKQCQIVSPNWKIVTSITYIHIVWDEITYPFPKFSVEVWEWISVFITRFIGHMIRPLVFLSA